MKLVGFLIAAALLCCSSNVWSAPDGENSYAMFSDMSAKIDKQAVVKFIGGNIKGNFGLPRQRVVAAFFIAREIPQQLPVLHLDGENTLYLGCQLHDCDVKSATAVNREGQIQAIVLYHPNWILSNEAEGKQSCAYSRDNKYRSCPDPFGKSRMKFTMFMPLNNLASPLYNEIKQWAIKLDPYAPVNIITVPVH